MRNQGSFRAPCTRLFNTGFITAALILLLTAFTAQASRYVYDANGRVVGVINDSGQAARYQYDAVGNLIEVAATTGQPIVFDMQPNSGPAGTLVQVFGYALPTAAGQQVLFNGSAAALVSASNEQIQFTVPTLATGSYAVTLSTSAGPTALGNFQIAPSLAPPTISSVSHACAPFDTAVSLTGSGFDIKPGATRVEVGGRLAKITAITETALSFRAPLHTPGGPVRVITEAGAAQSSSVLYLVAPSPVADPCLTLSAGVELQIDGGIANVQLSGAAPVAEYAFYAERGQWISLHFANPTQSSFSVAATLLTPEARKHPFVDLGGTAYESAVLSPSAMSLHLMPIKRTGFHVVHLKRTSAAALGFDIRATGAAGVQKGSIVTYQAAPGQSIRMLYAAQPGDDITVGLQANNSSPDSVNSTLYLYSPDYVPITPEIGSFSNCGEGSTCALNLKKFSSAAVYPFLSTSQSTGSVAQATLWFTDALRPRLMPNVPQSIAITKPGQDAHFPVYAEAGSGFSINVRNLVLSTEANGIITFRLFAPDGTLVPTKFTATAGSGNGQFGPPRTLISAFQLPMTGFYSATLDPARGALASGDIELDPGIPLVLGAAPLAVSHNGAGRVARFTIDGTAGQKIGVGLTNVQIIPSAQSLQAWIYLPTGDLLSNSPTTCFIQSGIYPGCDLDLGPLPFSGTYVIVVDSPIAVTSASYQILATADTELALSDTLQNVAIQRRGGNARLYFQGTPGVAKTIHVEGQTTAPGNPVDYIVMRPDGFPLVKAPLYAHGSITGSGPASLRIGDFPLAGTYTVFVDPNAGVTAQFNAKISSGVLDNSQIPTVLPVIPGPWFYSTMTAPLNAHITVGVNIQSIVNATEQLKIEVVDPQNRRMFDPDYFSFGVAYDVQCPTSNTYCDFDLFNVTVPGTYQVVVWPGTAKRTDAQLGVAQVFDNEATGRDTTFALTSAGQNGRLNFSAQSGEGLNVVLTRQASAYPSAEISFHLFDPLGNKLMSGALFNGQATNTVGLPSIPATGMYSIVLDPRQGTPALVRAQLLPQ